MAPSEATNPPHKGVPYYVRAGAMGIPAILFGLVVSGWIAFIPGAMAGHADFRQLYAAGYMIRAGMGHRLYDYDVQKDFQDRLVSPEAIALPYIRPAYQALLFVPFTFVSYRGAYWIMVALNMALLTVSFQLLIPYMSMLRTIWTWLPLAIFASFLPTGAALIQGQDSILLLVLLAAAFVALSKCNEFTAGLLTALGLFKFQFVVPIALLFLIWRRWRFSGGFAIVATALSALSVWLTGASQIRIYIRSLFSMGAGLAFVPKLFNYPMRLQVMENLHGLVFGISRGRFSSKWQLGTVIVLSCLFFAWTGFKGRKITSPTELMLLAIPCGVLVSYYAFTHDLSVLLIPIVMTLNRFLARVDSKAGKLPVMSALLVFVAPTMQVFSPNQLYLGALTIAFLLGSIALTANTTSVIYLDVEPGHNSAQ
jgi:Glycosyltransferase family 87